jgi:ribosomal protein S18 acetylase RimI-like enzyme
MPRVADNVIDVRTVRPGDPGWDAHVGLFADYRVHYGQDREPQQCDRWLREQLDAGRYHCYLVHSGPEGRPAGMANVAVSPASMALSVFWQLRDLYVAPDRRRRGVGRALLDVVVADARAAGAARISLQTEVGNDQAVALYRSADFEVVSELTMLNLVL